MRMQMLRNLCRTVSGAGLVLLSAAAFAQGAAGYPNRTVKLIVPFAAGGGTSLDVVAGSQKFVAADVERWGKVIRDGNIKAD